ncbi:MAG: hypothetical protein WCE75_09670 [Terracidiphilus sp.]
MRLRSAFLPYLLFLSAAWAGAQSPSDGRVEGKAYLNTFFHLSYAWPAILQPQEFSAMNLPKASPRGVEFFLFAARQGSEPYGVVMIAEKSRALTSNPKDFQDAADLISRVKRGIDPSLPWKPLGERHVKNESGLAVDEFDYLVAREYSSAFVVTLDGDLIVARCNARTAADLKVMTDSLLAMRRTK